MPGNDPTREPCPDRIMDDAGAGFAMGFVGGTFFQFIKGVYSHPRGERISGGFQTARMNASRIGGSFAVWSTLYSATDCSMVFLRQEEDPWNSIISGAAVGGLLQIRKGLRRTIGGAIGCGVLMALIEGLMLTVNRSLEGLQQDDLAGLPNQTVVPEIQTTAVPEGNAIWRWFQRPKESEKESETKILESFDTPTPMPTFEFPHQPEN